MCSQSAPVCAVLCCIALAWRPRWRSVFNTHRDTDRHKSALSKQLQGDSYYKRCTHRGTHDCHTTRHREHHQQRSVGAQQTHAHGCHTSDEVEDSLHARPGHSHGKTALEANRRQEGLVDSRSCVEDGLRLFSSPTGKQPARTLGQVADAQERDHRHGDSRIEGQASPARAVQNEEDTTLGDGHELCQEVKGDARAANAKAHDQANDQKPGEGRSSCSDEATGGDDDAGQQEGHLASIAIGEHAEEVGANHNAGEDDRGDRGLLRGAQVEVCAGTGREEG
eukprot:scaffold4233_cov180-Ochromonas_danica.AAC.8